MAKLSQMILALRSVGLRRSLQTIIYTLGKERLNRAYMRAYSQQRPTLPGELREVTPSPEGIRADFENACLRIACLTDDMIHISWVSTGAQGNNKPVHYAIAKTDWPPLELECKLTPQGYEITSKRFQISLHHDGGLIFYQQDGSILRQDLPPVMIGKGWQSQAFLQKSEHIFGLGEHAVDLQLRGHSFQLWNTDPGGSYGRETDPIYMPIPVYLGIHEHGCYLIFYENHHRGAISFDPTSAPDARATISFEGGNLDYYLIAGSPEYALERYTELTGRPGLPPLWSLGYHQSRWGYKDEQDIRTVLAGFVSHNLPISALHLDIDYMQGYRVFTVDLERFPDLASLIRQTNEQGVHIVAILDPGVKVDPDYEVYQEGMRQGMFCRLPSGKICKGLVWPGWSVFPDFTSPTVRAWWGKHYRRLIEAGIEGFWHDMNEPTSFSAWGSLDLPLAVCHDLEGTGGDHHEAHNIYAFQMNRAGYEAVRKLNPTKRPWLISRSGWAGQQRYAWNWTGDIESSWDALKVTIATVLNLGLSGFPYSGPDIGGFSGNPSAELYLRWFQMSAFLPFFRTHSAIGTASREPWVYGEPYTRIIRQFLQLRYRLLPYYYTLAWETSQTGHPIVRPLFWRANQPFDPVVPLLDVDDAFLIGDHLLIAPVTQPDCTSRQVILPDGDWYSLWDDEHYRGPAAITVPTPLEQIPAFVRSTCVLPMSDNDALELHVYACHESKHDNSLPPRRFALYSDEGEGFGTWRIDEWTLEQETEPWILRWHSSGGYPFPYASVRIKFHGVRPSETSIDDKAVINKSGFIETEIFNQARFWFR